MWSRLIVDYDFAIKRGRKSRDIIPLRFSSTLPTTEDKYSCRCKKVPVPVRSKDSIPKKGALENLLLVYIFYVNTQEIKTKEKIKFEFFPAALCLKWAIVIIQPRLLLSFIFCKVENKIRAFYTD